MYSNIEWLNRNEKNDLIGPVSVRTRERSLVFKCTDEYARAIRFIDLIVKFVCSKIYV